MIFKGVVSPGLGEGKFYIKIYKEKIKEKTGIEPFEGTLNVVLSEDDYNRLTENLKNAFVIHPFKKGHKSYKQVKLFRCRVNKNSKVFDAFVVFPEIRKHDMVEIISDVNLKKEMNIDYGDYVYISY